MNAGDGDSARIADYDYRMLRAKRRKDTCMDLEISTLVKKYFTQERLAVTESASQCKGARWRR